MRNSVLNRIIAAISAIFMPIINIMTAAGITKGFLALFVSLGWIAQDSGTYLICNAIADAFFYFLPVSSLALPFSLAADRRCASCRTSRLTHNTYTLTFDVRSSR